MSSIGSLFSRFDAWYNEVTGQGTARDRTAYGSFVDSGRVDDAQLAALYYGNAVAKKIVELIPKMIQRAGHTVVMLDEEGKPDDELTKLVRDKAKELEISQRMYEAQLWSRLYGGAGIIAIGGKQLDQPMNELKPGPLMCFVVIDRRYLRIAQNYSDVKNPHYGRPELYEVLPEPLPYAGPFTTKSVQPGARVHSSRVFQYVGVKVDRFESTKVEGWGYSVLQSVYMKLRGGDSAFDSLVALLAEASISVFKIKGLISALVSKKKDEISERMRFTDFSKGVLRSVVLDADKEDYTRTAIQFGGIADSIDRVYQSVAADADMPMTVLFGVSPAGMNATGESDMRQWYDRCDAVRREEVEPHLERAYRLIAASEGYEGYTPAITFGTFWQMTEKERSEMAKATAETMKTWIDALVLEPEAVAVALFGSGVFDPDATPGVDVKALQKSLKPVAGETGSNFELTPSDLAAIIPLGKALKKAIGEELTLPDGSRDPDNDLSVAAYAAKQQAAAEAAGAAQGAAALPTATPEQKAVAALLPPGTGPVPQGFGGGGAPPAPTTPPVV